jgi:hypothetical protein
MAAARDNKRLPIAARRTSLKDDFDNADLCLKIVG